MNSLKNDEFFEELKHENKILKEQKSKLLYLINQEKAERIYLESLIDDIDINKKSEEKELWLQTKLILVLSKDMKN